MSGSTRRETQFALTEPVAQSDDAATPCRTLRGPRTAEEIVSATIIAGLALQIATTPKQRRTALAQLDALKQERKGGAT